MIIIGAEGQQYRVDVSVGKDPVPGSYDVIGREWGFRVDGKAYKFKEPLPFTLKDYKADRELILKHGAKSSAEIYDAGYAVMLYNTSNERFTFRFREEQFDFKDGESVKPHLEIWPSTGVRMCKVEILRGLRV